MDERIQREKEFHNDAFADRRREVVNRFYETTVAMYREYDEIIRSVCRDKMVLDYGCGTGLLSGTLCEMGADVTGIDISEEAIRQATERLIEMGFKDHSRFKVMDAEHLAFPDETFDVVCGSAILHHLNLESALLELKRVLKPEGIAIFTEPMGHNPLINLYRKMTPHLRTPDEHPILMKDLRWMKSQYPGMKIQWYSLFTPLVAIFPSSVQSILLPPVEWLDRITFKLPFMRPLAWLIIIKLAK